MFDWLVDAEELVRAGAESLQGSSISGPEAAGMFSCAERLVRLAEFVKLTSLARVIETKQHFEEGAATPGRFVARVAGCSLGAGGRLAETAEQLQTLPILERSLRRGELERGAAEIVARAAHDAPEREEELVRLATQVPFSELVRRCRQEVSSRQREGDKVAAENELHDKRYLRTWTGRDGSGRGEFALDPLAYGRLLASLEKETKELVKDAAKREGERPSLAQLQADALVALADRPIGEGGGARPQLVLRVDLAAFRRGETTPGESCHLEGVGEVSVTTARSLLGDSFLKLVIKDGRDPRSITHLGRTVRAHLETALWERDGGCVVCGTTRYIERDHWQVDYKDSGPTELENLCLLCVSCHRMKTHRGWRLEGGPGRWRWTAPEGFSDRDDDGGRSPTPPPPAPTPPTSSQRAA